MDHFLLIGGWLLYVNSAHALGKLMGIIPLSAGAWKWEHTPEHLQFPKVMLSICACCAISMFAWEFIHFRWFVALMHIGAGFLLAVVVIQFLEVRFRILLVKLGWIPLVVLNGYLWLRGFFR